MLAATVDGLRIVSLYAPNGRVVGSPFYAGKLAWFERLARWVREDDATSGAPLLLGGDLNVAPTDRDVWDAAAVHGGTHVSEPERAAFRALLDLGLTDGYRAHPRRGRSLLVVGLPGRHVPQELRDADRPPAGVGAGGARGSSTPRSTATRARDRRSRPTTRRSASTSTSRAARSTRTGRAPSPASRQGRSRPVARTERLCYKRRPFSDLGYSRPMNDRSEPTRPLRIDAERNRGRIVEAAQAAFAEHGLDVPLEAVAERAGVGIATLYRRFPGRDDLIAACFEHRLAEYARAAEEALEADDAWTGLAGYVERICAMQSADRGLKDVLTRTFPDARTLEAHRRRGYDLLMRLIERAQDDGSLRRDRRPRGCGPAADGQCRRRPGHRSGGTRGLAAVRRADARRAAERRGHGRSRLHRARAR